MFPRWWQGSSTLRRTGLILAVSGLLVLAFALPVVSWGSNDDATATVQGWADIFGCSVALLGLAIALLDRNRSINRPSRHLLNEAADRLMRQALQVESQQRSRLLGTGRPGTTAANLRYRQSEQRRPIGGGQGTEGELNSIGQYFTEFTGRRLAILGSPGSGKSVLALELVIQLLEIRKQQIDPRVRAHIPVPVRCTLAAWNTERPLATWLAEQVATRFNMSEPTAAALIEDERILPVLDGLDEMDAPRTGSRRAIAALEQLNAYIHGRTGAPVVITCRVDKYRCLRETNGLVLRPAVEVTIEPLSPAQIREYLDWEYDSSTDWQLREDWEHLLTRMESDSDQHLHRLLCTPWNLTLAVTYHRDGGDLTTLLPTDGEATEPAATPGQAPGQALGQALGQKAGRRTSPAPDGRYQRRVRNLLLSAFIPARARLHPSEYWTEQQVIDWCRNLATHLGREVDIVPHRWGHRLGDWVRRRHVLVATSTTTALMICTIVVTAITKIDSQPVTNSAANGAPAGGTTASATVLMRALAMMAACAFPMLSMRHARRDEVQPSLMNPRQLRTVRGRHKLLEALGRWLLIGGAWGGAFGCILGLRGDRTGAVGNGLALGIAICLVFGLTDGLRPIGETITDPRDPVRNDLVAWLGCGLAVGISGMVEGILFPNAPGGTVVAAVVSLTAGALLGLVLGLAFGVAGHAWMRYAIAVVGGSNRQQVPFRFGRFLHWAQEAGILRVAGGSYQFRHVALRDWLRTEPDTATAAR